ncbi:MAG: extracellular solute-binding protein [Ruminococcus sp.]|nr:extracellular solute-binding protein [Ruminococcus sp.]
MKNRIRKITAILSAAALLAGCTQQETGQPANNQSAPDIPKTEQLFQCKALTQPQEGTELLSLEYYDGQLYVLRSETDGSVSVCTCNRTGIGAKRFSYTPSGENAYVSDFCVNADGEFVFSVQSGSNPDMSPEEKNPDFDWNEYYNGFVYTHSLDILSEDGKLISSVECDASGTVCIDENEDYIIASHSGMGEADIIRMRPDSFSEILPDTGLNYFIDFEKAADGSLLLLGQKNGGSVLKKWDAAKGVFTDLSLPQTEGMLLHDIITGTSADVPYYLCSDEGIYAVSADNTVSEAVNSLDSGLPSLSGSSLFCTGENTFTGFIFRSQSGIYLAEISPDTEEKPEAEILTLGCYDVYSVLSNAVAEYNRSQDAYKIQVKKYAEYDDTDTGISKSLLRLHEDIAAGTAPDIIVLWGDHTTLSESGGLLNLYDVMGTNGTYAKEDFLPSYLEATESNGGLYWIQAEFGLHTLYANTGMTDGKTTWTTAEFLEICRECDTKGIGILDYQKKETFMELVMTGDRFIDYENGVCSFDSPDFLEALRFASEMEESADLDYENMTMEEIDAANYERTLKYPNGQQLIYSFGGSVWMLSEHVMSLAMSGDHPSAMIGYPTADGTGGYFFSCLNEQYAISSSCAHPEAAWQFINEQLKTDTTRPTGFSVVDKLLCESLQNDMEQQNSYDIGSINGVDIVYPEITQEDVDKLYNILLSIDKMPVRNEAVNEICNNVMQGFYDGTKTPEQTAEELQERVGLYLKENQ